MKGAIPCVLFIVFLVLVSSVMEAQTEIGTNDFQISQMGVNGDTNVDAEDPVIAYNSTNNEYLVVWASTNGDGNGWEIFGQRVGADGSVAGADFRISDMGPDGSTSFSGRKPNVAYNSNANEYLVIWYGNDNIAPLGNNELEIFGQRLAADGSEIGANDFRISDMGVDGEPGGIIGGRNAISYNSLNNEYLVVWVGFDGDPSQVEAFGQLLEADGTEIGNNDFRISDMGPDGVFGYGVNEVAATFNPIFNNYLVVWSGDDNTGTLVEGDVEIFGQRLSSIGLEIGANDFRISDLGDDGETNYGASSPAVTYNTVNNEYFVVWNGKDNAAPLVTDEREVFGQRLSVVGSEVGANDFRISDMGADGQSFAFTLTPSLTYNPNQNEYLVVWWGDDASINSQIHIQLLSAQGGELGTNDLLISDSNWDTDLYPTVAYNSAAGEYLVAWAKTSNVGSFVHGEYEVFGQRLNGAAVLPVELIDFTAQRKEHAVDLFWQTASEYNNRGFEIQRSSDGILFKTIGWEDGANTTHLAQAYQFNDHTVKAGSSYYYRLQQIDFDGASSYSNVVHVNFLSTDIIYLFPNPFVASISIEAEELFPLKMTIYNGLGQLVFSKTLKEKESTIDLNALAKGWYHVLLWQEDDVLIHSEKVLKK